MKRHLYITIRIINSTKIEFEFTKSFVQKANHHSSESNNFNNQIAQQPTATVFANANTTKQRKKDEISKDVTVYQTENTFLSPNRTHLPAFPPKGKNIFAVARAEYSRSLRTLFIIMILRSSFHAVFPACGGALLYIIHNIYFIFCVVMRAACARSLVTVRSHETNINANVAR